MDNIRFDDACVHNARHLLRLSSYGTRCGREGGADVQRVERGTR